MLNNRATELKQVSKLPTTLKNKYIYTINPKS